MDVSQEPIMLRHVHYQPQQYPFNPQGESPNERFKNFFRHRRISMFFKELFAQLGHFQRLNL
jgi:hypothetical protein